MAAQVELTELLRLRSCQFEAFPFTHPLPRLERSGVVSVMEYHGDRGFALPADGAELPVLGRGNVLGRFVLIPRPDTTVTLEQRVVAVAIADQVGAALADPDRHHTPTVKRRRRGLRGRGTHEGGSTASAVRATGAPAEGVRTRPAWPGNA